MKTLVKIIGFLFISIILIFVLVGTLAVMNDKATPVYLEEFESSSFDEQSEILINLDTLSLSNVLDIKRVQINEETINKLIYKNMDDFTDKSIVLGDTNLNILSAWIELEQDEIKLYTLVEAKGIETTLTMSLNVTNSDDGIKMSVSQLKIGKLPLPKPLLTSILNPFDDSITDSYEYGDIQIDELMVTVMSSHIQELIVDSLNTDLFVFDSLKVGSGNLVLYYQFNPDNLNSAAFINGFNELKTLIDDPALLNDITSLLDLSDTNQANFNEQFTDVVSLLQGKMDNTTNNEFTEEENAMIDSMKEDFSKLPTEKQDEVIDSIESKMDTTVVTELNEAMGSLETDQYSSVTDLIKGFLGS